MRTAPGSDGIWLLNNPRFSYETLRLLGKLTTVIGVLTV